VRDRLRRVRIVSEPVSDYIVFEHAVTPGVNLSAGEEIRWLGRQRVSDLALPVNDLWVLDGRVVQFYYFAGDGSSTGDEVTEDPAPSTSSAHRRADIVQCPSRPPGPRRPAARDPSRRRSQRP
jgi:Family of unknown function (DUF6879)